MNDRPKVEPSAAHRDAARSTFEWFVALQDAGFTEAQATDIIGVALGHAIRGTAGPE